LGVSGRTRDRAASAATVESPPGSSADACPTEEE
jgi:hypothetical protein